MSTPRSLDVWEGIEALRRRGATVKPITIPRLRDSTCSKRANLPANTSFASTNAATSPASVVIYAS